MPGLLIHLAIATAGLIVIYLLRFKWEFSLSFFLGHFVPDVIKFGFSAVKQGTLAIFSVERDLFYHALSEITSNPANWFTLSFFFIGITLLLYHYHYIKKKKMVEYDKLLIFFLLGVLIHLILDAFIFETGPWI